MDEINISLEIGQINTLLTAVLIAQMHTEKELPGYDRLKAMESKLSCIIDRYYSSPPKTKMP